MKRAGVAAAIIAVLLSMSLATVSAQWDVIEASPHVVTRTIEVPFPQIDFRSDLDPHVAEAIDAAIAERVVGMIQELLPLGNIFGRSEVTLDAHDVLSITMSYSGYHPPMAHPAHVMTSLTADLRTGNIYRLRDLFDDDGYIDIISKEVARQIEAKEIGLFDEFMRISPNQQFYLTPKALVVYYQVYEIAPYVFGFPQFEIPYEMLAAIAKKGGPIDRLVNEP